MLNYPQARQTVINQAKRSSRPRTTANVGLWDALGYVLATEIRADRDYPPFDRSTRDGYAVRAADAHAGAALRCIGEIKAGDTVTTPLAPNTCMQIMTGAAVPSGADAVMMIEYTHRGADRVRCDRDARPGQNIVPRSSEAKSGQVLLTRGTRLGYAELAIAGQVGETKLRCAAKPRVAILSTGDEVVPVDALPGPFQIRNSNSVSLAAQVRLAGGEPVLLGNAADQAEALRAKIERGLRDDVLVLSGGVSAGKYDLVETVLKDLGTEFYFDAVAIRPGKPAVFGRCQDVFVFGLPGNPVSTMVTFELFVTPTLDILSGAEPRPLPLLQARLSEPINEQPGLMHFLPARVDWTEPNPSNSPLSNSIPQVRALPWHGSGDIVALAQANCFLVIAADHCQIAKGESVSVLMRRDVM